MKRFVSFFAIFMVALSYLILTALIGYSLRQSWNTKEVTTTAEIIEILEADFTQIKTTRITNADNPDVIINFTKQEKKVCFMTLVVPAVIASALVITLTILKRKIKQET